MSKSRGCQPFPVWSLIVTSAVVVAGITVASLDRSVDFSLYFSSLPPLVAAALACVAGVVALHVLQKHFGFCVILSGSNWRGWITAVAAAVPFMATVTFADLVLRFPADINVSLPTALIFYPTIAFVAEISLHVIPFAIALWIFTRLFTVWSEDSRVCLSILLAALPEAIFQSSASHFQGSDLQLLTLFVTVQLFVFGLVELKLFHRFDFVCMYLFRLTYYGYWHIVWGSLRV